LKVYIPFAYDYGESYPEMEDDKYFGWTNEVDAIKWADKENEKSRGDGTRIIIRTFEIRNENPS
jgi:hypothetical protein